jgi:hypothetical protein
MDIKQFIQQSNQSISFGKNQYREMIAKAFVNKIVAEKISSESEVDLPADMIPDLAKPYVNSVSKKDIVDHNPDKDKIDLSQYTLKLQGITLS